jgi:cell division protein FtsI (penicillin-binding protein 3)
MAKRKPIKKKDSNSIIFNRFMFIVALFAVWIGLIGVRLVHLQISENQWLRDKALNQRRDESRSKMLRGSIYDRSNRALAISVKVKSLYANPQDIEDVPATAQKLSIVLKSLLLSTKPKLKVNALFG